MRKINSRSVYVILIIVLVVGLALLFAYQNFNPTGKAFSGSLGKIPIKQQVIPIEQQTTYPIIQKNSLGEAYSVFANNLPNNLKVKMKEMGLDNERAPHIYPIGCIDYGDMHGNWTIFRDPQGYWRARYMGPYPTKMDPYYVVNISDMGSPVEVWPDNLRQGEIAYSIDGCGAWLNNGPACVQVNSFCDSPTTMTQATIFCTGNCTGNLENGSYGCDPDGFPRGYGYWGGKCNYPPRSDFLNNASNPLIS